MSDFGPIEADGAITSPLANAPEPAQTSLKQKSLAWRYGLAVLLVAAATLMMSLITWSGYFSPTFALFYLAVLLSAWYGGPYPGLAVTALSALAGAYFFVSPTTTTALYKDNPFGHNIMIMSKWEE